MLYGSTTFGVGSGVDLLEHIVATLFCPFLAFAIGFVTCFYSKLEERFGVMAGIVAVITIMCYVALAIFGK